MKFTCTQQDLWRGLSTVNHAVSSRSTLPILANILLTTEHGRLKLSATNLEIGINCWIDAEIVEEGTTTLPAKTFSDLVSTLRPSPLELSTPEDSHIVTIKGQGSTSTVKGMDPSEYPLIPGVEGAETPITLEVVTLKEMIEQTVIAAATDDSRPVFTGVHVEFTEEEMVFASADAFRLAVRRQILPEGFAGDHDPLLIPAKTLSELARILPSDGTVEMTVTPNRSQVLFHTPQVDLVSRLIEGTFPNFRQILPKEYKTRAVIETKEFAAAIKSVVPFARDNSNIARVKFGSETLTIESASEDVGSNVSTIAASVETDPMYELSEIYNFNVKYLSDVLSVIETPEVAFEVTSPARPGVIKPVGATNYTHVIMPMSVNR